MKNRLNDFFWFGFTNKNISVFNEKSDYNLESSPLINGKKVSLEKALEEFRYLLKKNPQIHFDGLSSDQKSIDVVLDFAEKRRSSIDHMEAEEINNFFLAFQKYGASIISFNELKNRSDFVVFIGNFNKQLIESFFENIGWQRPKIKKSIFFVTENINSDFHNSFKVMNLLNTINSIPNILQEESICKKINQIKQKLKSSKYPVVVINPGNHFMVSEHIFKVVAHINNNIRKLRIFKFSGLNNSAGFINSCVTKTGYPNSISFNDWGVSYDPIGNSSKKQKDIAKLQIYI